MGAGGETGAGGEGGARGEQRRDGWAAGLSRARLARARLARAQLARAQLTRARLDGRAGARTASWDRDARGGLW
ncbi:pentapeptide repeat-containing protein [Lentzea pudingi]|uniref:pentapeptide repeat-containing protein n=1 Tax=Lentzea pudingi TaxID=1789439 RepID=UPI0035711DC7